MSRSPATPTIDREALGLAAPQPGDPIATWRSVRARVLAWRWRHRKSLAIAVPLLVAVAVLRAWGLAHGPAIADDEGTYVAQAWAVQVHHALAPYTYWYDHPPFGWIQLAGYTWVTGVFGGHGLTVIAVRRLMVGYAVLDGALLYTLARRLGLRRGWAALGLLLWAVSPLAVGYSRMVYLDNIALPWALAAFVLAATRRRSLWAQVASGLCFAAAVLSKETMFLLLPGLLLVVRRHTARQTRAFCLAGFAAAALLALSLYPLLAVLKGELLPGPGHVSLLQALQFQFLSRPSTGTALAAGTGSRAVVDQWVSLDGWLLLLGLVSTPICLAVSRLRPVGVVMAVLLVAGLRPGYLPIPFVITVLPFAALAAAGAMDAGWRSLQPLPPTPILPNARLVASRRRAGRIAVAAGTALALVALLPGWLDGNRALASTDQTASTRAAEAWLESHHSPATTHSPGDILVDDTMWADLVTHGVPATRVVWFYKLDYVTNLDPSVRRRIATYTDFQTVVLTPVIRSALAHSPAATFGIVRQALAHSHTVATFGTGAQRIEIRRVQAAPAGSTSKGTH